MGNHIVKVLEVDSVTHNVKRFVLERPNGFTFIPGQATELSINKPNLKEEARPFTFTSIDSSNHLEFIIKIYEGHDGMTEKLGQIAVGDELIIHDIFGAIIYQGDGVFIAAGTGITPFISIFRDLKEKDQLVGNRLLFANRTDQDLILKDELAELLGSDYTNLIGSHVDSTVLAGYVQPDQHYYVCGPDAFTDKVVSLLQDLGMNKSKIIIEI